MTDSVSAGRPHLTGPIFLSRIEYVRQFYGAASVGSCDHNACVILFTKNV